MTGKKKRIRMENLASLPNVFQLQKENKGNWSAIFQNSNPITLELGCGKGDYTVALAEKFPQRNFIGMDIKGPRLWVGAQRAWQQKLKNAVFLRGYADHLPDYFSPSEISEFWIPFPDPYPQKGKKNKRLTSAKFISLYQQISARGCRLHFKTDDEKLYQFTLQVLSSLKLNTITFSENIYAEELKPEEVYIKTDFEKRHLAAGKTIRYICFEL